MIGNHVVASEQQRNAPNTAQSHECVDYTTKNCGLTAEYPRDYVKAEQTDAAPVDCADNCEYKRDFVKHIFHSFALIIAQAGINIHKMRFE